MTRILTAAVAVCLTPLLACTAMSMPQAPDGEPYVRGPIRSITHHATASGLLVDGGPGSREPCGISAAVDAETRYLRRSPQGVVRAVSLGDLSVGDTVEVYVSGGVAESCPVQGRASTVVLVARDEG